jgi:ubiquinone/menaquinone biosynthesis C-methylase UbiE
MKEKYDSRMVEYHHIHATSETQFDIFFQILNISENQKVIDIGGGNGEIILELKKRHPNLNFYYNLLEPSNLQLIKGKELITKTLGSEHCQKYIQFLEVDLFSFNSETKYDHIILKMVFQEFSLANKISALKKAKSMLNEDGKLTLWRPYLQKNTRDFFSAVILKKDELANYNYLLQPTYFESEEQFKELLIEANIIPSKPIFIFEYLFDTFRRFESEFLGNQELYQRWLDFIQESYEKEHNDLKNQIKLVRGDNRIYINFQRAIYQF